MESKMLEIRDTATRMSVIAIRTNPENANEEVIFDRAGWDRQSIILLDINGHVIANNDAYQWPNRTLKIAHKFIEHCYDDIKNYSSINVEKIIETYGKHKDELGR